ncbi:MAG: MBOAT family protein [Schleiferiaceae bacterium]
MEQYIDWILSFFRYDDTQPFVFTQIAFWVFFALVLTGYSIVYKKRAARNAFLFLVSLFFYWKTSGFFFLILLFSTVTDFFIGKRIYKTQSKSGKQGWVALSVTVNLMVLVYFKYAYFFTESFNDLFGTDVAVYNHFSLWSNQYLGTDFVFDKILLPVGISFFTFQTISYSVDIYRGLIKPVNNLLDFGFYVSFFPQLVAGPIVRASDFVPQLYKEYSLSKEEFGLAIFWIVNGLFKKMFLADYLAVNFVDRVFANPLSHSGFENMMALFGYSIQVYADFSGYTDIAIGVALLLGFRLPTNFNSPYKANSVGDFWRRWHISLSSWLKDYLYIPMGGNRSGSYFSYIMVLVIFFFVSLLAQTWIVPAVLASLLVLGGLLIRFVPAVKKRVDTNINLMLTMLIGGLWHGASWNFVLWGGLNGIGLVVYKGWKKISPWRDKSRWYNHAWSVLLTFTFITFTRTWFRSPDFSSALQMLHQIGNDFKPELIPDVVSAFYKVFLVMVFGMVIHWLPSSIKEMYRGWFVRTPFWAKIVIGVLTFTILYQVISSDLQPFIYFAF